MSGGAIVRSCLAILAGCLLLAGCQTVQPTAEVAEPQPQASAVVPAVPAVRPRQVSDAENLLAYFAQLRKLTGIELAREHDAARQAYGRTRTDYNGVRLAMVMGLPNTPFFDEPRALDLLDPIARNSDASLSALAWLLASQIHERRRLDANVQALQQKLDALKSLERSLIERRR